MVHLAGQAVGSGDCDEPAKKLFDVATQVWPYLDAYDKLSIRQSCRHGLRAHDCLATALSIHDLWGRVLPGAPQEIAAALRKMVRRGCSPQELILRLRGCSAAAREARGFAVLSAFGPRKSVPGQAAHGGAGGSRAFDRSNSGCSGLCSDGSIAAAAAAAATSESSNTGGSARLSSSCCSSGSSGIGGASGHSALLADQGIGERSSNSAGFDASCGLGEVGGGGGGDPGGILSLSPSLTSLRLEGVPLSPRVLRALGAAGRCLTRLKLYGYELSGDGGVVTASAAVLGASPFAGAKATAATTAGGATRKHAEQLGPAPPRTAKCRDAPASGDEDGSSPQPRTAAAKAAAGRQRGALSQTLQAIVGPAAQTGRTPTGPVVTRGSQEDRGVPALLRLLGPQLQELTFQDCLLGNADEPLAGLLLVTTDPPLEAASMPTTSHPNVSGRTGQGEKGSRRICSGSCGGGSPSGCGEAVAVELVDVSEAVHVGATPPQPPLLAALQSCAALQHLGLRHSAATGCPVLQLLLRQGQGCDGDTARGRTSVAVARRPFLGYLTQLLSLKLQTALPKPGGVRGLSSALMPLTGLTRLELLERTAVPSVAALLLPPETAAAAAAIAAVSFRNLRELRLDGSQVTMAAELAALAALQKLTMLSFGSLTVSLWSVGGEGDAASDAAAAAMMSEAAALPLPEALRELSVAAPLPPAALLRLRRPPTLRTLRLTGFTLGMHDVGEYDADDAAAEAPLPMRVASEYQLSEAIKLLHGRFAYRDLGVELHVGFQSHMACRRRYLAAPPGADRPAGHWSWASHLRPLTLQGLELAGLDLRDSDVASLARELGTLEDLRLDCRYPLAAMAHLAALRRLRRLLLNASFWQAQAPEALPPVLQPVGQAQQQPHQQPHGLSAGLEQEAVGQQQQQLARSDAAAAAVALTSLCAAAPECLYDIALASYGRASARFCAMQAMLQVESELPRVGCGALRLWVCP